MCGISGFCGFERNHLEEAEAHRHAPVSMRTAIAHRGHDQTGEADFTIVYNGEIYNAGALREELEALGSAFQTTCDTKVILQGHIRWGPDVARRLSGIFAFAIWDEVAQQLTPALDRDGLRESPYWALESHVHEDSNRATVARVSELIRNAVCRQMVSDVPVCSFVSSGLNSSVVTVLANRFMQESGGQLHTFSFDLSGNDTYFATNGFQPERDGPMWTSFFPICTSPLRACRFRQGRVLHAGRHADGLPLVRPADGGAPAARLFHPDRRPEAKVSFEPLIPLDKHPAQTYNERDASVFIPV